MYNMAHPFLYKKAKNGTFATKKGARPTTHIYLESVSPRQCHKHIYMTTSLSILKK